MIDRNGLRLKPIDPPGSCLGLATGSAKKRAFPIADLEGTRVAIEVLIFLR